MQYDAIVKIYDENHTENIFMANVINYVEYL